MTNSSAPAFADVLLPLRLQSPYTYRIPENLRGEVTEGARVIVPFGTNKLYTAIVLRVHDSPPEKYNARFLENLLDTQAVVKPFQLTFWRWMADYYLCTLGEVMNVALPSGLKLSSESRIFLNTLIEVDHSALTDREFMITEALEIHKTLTLQQVSDILQIKSYQPVIKSLVDKGVVLVDELIKPKYRAKKETFLSLHPDYASDKALKEIFDTLEKRAPNQLEILMRVIQRAGSGSGAVSRSEIIGADKNLAAALKSLVTKKILHTEERHLSLLPQPGEQGAQAKELNEEQNLALQQIRDLFNTKDVVLLHGVTGSGKTEIYVRLIQEELRQGRSTLFLLPEIALTTQLVNRLRVYFPSELLVYHSRQSERNKVEVWNELLQSEAPHVIVGPRSSLFLPAGHVGLIIIDEEHETSFKQHDPAPRYHARDAAMVLARQLNAKVLLGSATPSLESYFNSSTGKYGLVKLAARFGNVELPEIELVDLKELTRKKLLNSIFSDRLLSQIREETDNKKQVILFQNRRGYAPMITCTVCAWVPQCINCDVSLTYHKYRNEIRCHYCGYKEKPPSTCGACGNSVVNTKGFGTEKIEDELFILFPHLKTDRLDLDTTRNKNAFEEILKRFDNREIDVLIGTQMITKGLDFENVSMVGVINADQLLQFPDFRSYERSFQLMTQVAGRAGRRKEKGKVIIQTYSPGNPIFTYIIKGDYESFYQQELAEREKYHYPPYTRLVEITLKSKEESKVNDAAITLAKDLRQQFFHRVLGPEVPAISRVRNEYLRTILLKIEREVDQKKVKDNMRKILFNFEKNKQYSQVRIIPVVDPV